MRGHFLSLRMCIKMRTTLTLLCENTVGVPFGVIEAIMISHGH
jgi:hypothetical protein